MKTPDAASLAYAAAILDASAASPVVQGRPELEPSARAMARVGGLLRVCAGVTLATAIPPKGYPDDSDFFDAIGLLETVARDLPAAAPLLANVAGYLRAMVNATRAARGLK
jgi:hypothetical protein